MPNDPLFPSHYPGIGKVAILCEGDLVGYEKAFLDRWLREEPFELRDVDVWPCGTGHGLIAMADAIGRTVRIVAIEDRDFRTVDQANGDCATMLSNRERRNVAMRGWMTWERNEIENYFLDDPVLVPVMTSVFRCAERDVSTALDAAIGLLVPFQALQAAVASVRRTWDAVDPSFLFVPSRPTWTAGGLKPIDPDQVENELTTKCDQWRERLDSVGAIAETQSQHSVVATYRELLSRWASVTRSSPEWLDVWAGKEVLKLVRMQLASRFDSPAVAPDRRIPPVQWHELANNLQRNALDRDIERAIQPDLVHGLWENAANNAAAPVRSSLSRLRSLLQE